MATKIQDPEGKKDKPIRTFEDIAEGFQDPEEKNKPVKMAGKFLDFFEDPRTRALGEESTRYMHKAMESLNELMKFEQNQAKLNKMESEAKLAEAKVSALNPQGPSEQFSPPAPSGYETETMSPPAPSRYNTETRFDPMVAAMAGENDQFIAQSLAQILGQYGQRANQPNPYKDRLQRLKETALSDYEKTDPTEKSLSVGAGLHTPVGGLLNLISLPFGGTLGTDLLGGNVKEAKQEKMFKQIASFDALLANELQRDIHEFDKTNGLARIGFQALGVIEGSKRDKYGLVEATSRSSDSDDDPNIEGVTSTFRQQINNSIPDVAYSSGDEEMKRVWASGDQGSIDNSQGYGRELLNRFVALSSDRLDDTGRSKATQEFEKLFDSYRERYGSDIVKQIRDTLPVLNSSINTRFNPKPEDYPTSKFGFNMFKAKSDAVASHLMILDVFVKYLEELDTRSKVKAKKVAREKRKEREARLPSAHARHMIEVLSMPK